MSGTMSQSDLISDLKSMLGGTSDSFENDGREDFERLLTTAAAALSRDKPQKLTDTLSLVAEQPYYDAPALIIKAINYDWGMQELKFRMPWQTNFPKQLPAIKLVKTATGKKVHLFPAPTAAQIADLGSSFVYYYTAQYVIDKQAINTTIDEADRDLLLLRALVVAMTELAMKSAATPVSLGPGKYGSSPKNGTPAALAESLLNQYMVML